MYGVDRVILIVLDSVGVGALPDAAEYGPQDPLSNTLVNTARAVGGLDLPHLGQLGLGRIVPVQGVPPAQHPSGAFGRMAERSRGKDTTTGHWEIACVLSERGFPTYPDGFPADVIAEFERRIGRKSLGNYAASGTVIIQDLGDEHVRTGFPIVYTSADSVFQIACHTDVFTLEELYSFCKTARVLLNGVYGVARVIARPFAGTMPDFYRTKERRDFSLEPPEPTLLDITQQSGIKVTVVGKVDDLFSHRGFDKSYHSVNDLECIELVIKVLRETTDALIVANFVQFDMDWGHRNDINGFKNGLIEMDDGIGRIIAQLRENDLVFITADHGNDPTTPSTDHSREYVPILAQRNHMVGRDLGTRSTFADLAKTVAGYLGIEGIKHGEDFLKNSTA